MASTRSPPPSSCGCSGTAARCRWATQGPPRPESASRRGASARWASTRTPRSSPGRRWPRTATASSRSTSPFRRSSSSSSSPACDRVPLKETFEVRFEFERPPALGAARAARRLPAPLHAGDQPLPRRRRAAAFPRPRAGAAGPRLGGGPPAHGGLLGGPGALRPRGEPRARDAPALHRLRPCRRRRRVLPPAPERLAHRRGRRHLPVARDPAGRGAPARGAHPLARADLHPPRAARDGCG